MTQMSFAFRTMHISPSSRLGVYVGLSFPWRTVEICDANLPRTWAKAAKILVRKLCIKAKVEAHNSTSEVPNATWVKASCEIQKKANEVKWKWKTGRSNDILMFKQLLSNINKFLHMFKERKHAITHLEDKMDLRAWLKRMLNRDW